MLKTFPFFMIIMLAAESYAQIVSPLEPAFQEPSSQPMVTSIRTVLAPAKNADDRFQALESLYGSTIQASEENLRELELLTQPTSSIPERVAAIRVYALLQVPTNSAATNDRIRATLRMLAQSAQREVATAAILRYSRLPYAADTESLLDSNYIKSYLSKDDLYGELAHIFPFAPADRQIQLLERLDNGKSDYAMDILASNLKEKSMRARLSGAVRNKLIGVLERHQPAFSAAIGEFSLKEAITYSDWLHAFACIKSETSGESYESVILANVASPTANPKRAISFFASPEGKAAAAVLGYRKLQPTFERIASYSDHLPYPQHSAIKDFSASVLGLKYKIGP
jgi:hypothetical protein